LEPGCSTFSNRVAAIALIQPTHSPSQLACQTFQTFLADRARSYVLSSAPRSTCIAAPWHDANPNEWDYVDTVSCATFASGESHFEELIFSDLYCEILDWFAEVANNIKVYVHPKIDVTDWDEQAERLADAVKTDDAKDDDETGQIVGDVDEELDEVTHGMQKMEVSPGPSFLKLELMRVKQSLGNILVNEVEMTVKTKGEGQRLNKRQQC
jgi:hypothetical protein